MIHLPVNHPLRPLYRTLAGLVGLYVLLFGIVGIIESGEAGFFGRESIWALGLRTNLAFAILSTVVGAIVVAGCVIGRNVDRFINMAGGVIFLASGLIMLGLLESDLNLLNFTVGTCVVSFIIGLVLGIAGLYGKVGPPPEVQAEEGFRHGGEDPVSHAWERDDPHREDDPEHQRFA